MQNTHTQTSMQNFTDIFFNFYAWLLKMYIVIEDSSNLWKISWISLSFIIFLVLICKKKKKKKKKPFSCTSFPLEWLEFIFLFFYTVDCREANWKDLRFLTVFFDQYPSPKAIQHKNIIKQKERYWNFALSRCINFHKSIPFFSFLFNQSEVLCIGITGRNHLTYFLILVFPRTKFQFHY